MHQASTMHHPRKTNISLEDTESPFKRMLKRNMVSLSGLAVIAVAIAFAAALATWSVSDPSLSHSTTEPVRNALGGIGAIVADVLMQSIGLATAVVLFPVLVWGWRIFWYHRSGLNRKRLATWVCGTLIFSGALAALPVAQGWPLPTGMGGFLGDWLFSVPDTFFNGLTDGAKMLVGTVGLGLPALVMMAHAAGWIGRSPLHEPQAELPVNAQDADYDDYDSFDEDEDDNEDGRLSAAIGALSHWKLMATSAVQRTFFKKKQQPAQANAYAAHPAPIEPEYAHAEEVYEHEGYQQPYEHEGYAQAHYDQQPHEQPYHADYAASDEQPVYYEEEPAPEQQKGGLITNLRRKLAAKLLPEEDDGLREFYERGAVSYEQPAASHAAPQGAPVDFEHDGPSPRAPWEDPDPSHHPFHDASGEDFDADEQAFEEPLQAPVPTPAAPLRPIGIASPPEPMDINAPQAQPEDQQGGRVIPPAPAPVPGKRVQQEAQGRLPLPAQPQNDYELPPLMLLTEPPVNGRQQISQDALEQNARILEGVLEDFGVRGEIIEVRPGPVVTLYELEPAPGIKSSRVIGLADDIARSMSAISARVAVIPGKNAIGIELPNARRETVFLRELVAANDFEKSKAKLAMALGKTINGEAVIADLARMPHLLVAGTTGSGKSVSINTMILSLLYRLTPEQCKLIMIDPKMLELSIYDGIPHLLTPVVTDPNKAVVALKWTVREMEDRYKKMSKMGVRNIDGYNTRVEQAMKKGERFTRTVQTGFDRNTGEPIFEEEELPLEKMPFIVVVVDEMADLMMVAGKDIEGAIQRLAQMARAAGIHLIMATQRPSVDVITGTIKANFPTRISFQVTSKIDSRTILGEMGAEQLLGMGDMLYMAGGGKTQRVHGPFVSDDEVEEIVNHLKAQGTPQYLEEVTEEEDEGGSYDSLTAGSGNASNDLFDQAVAIVARDKKASTSYIQRRLSIGYNRAASLIERMEQEGIIGPANHAGKREILLRTDDNEMM
ncbi:DNA translocase FtsK [Pseudovibrio exalbescens]|uniref:DNA translocase FtsK n=1 Tax=Pseudovibrio exalbescens TaxID=197461 RepID=UPI0023673BE9|nr:DNA translocase FtsK [Pseudovibrio exalbescens]MDD7909462.1 DNA translocase FtsK [Pseudovibrio exalbescens]